MVFPVEEESCVDCLKQNIKILIVEVVAAFLVAWAFLP
jgi:hypothetical protein